MAGSKGGISENTAEYRLEDEDSQFQSDEESEILSDDEHLKETQRNRLH